MAYRERPILLGRVAELAETMSAFQRDGIQRAVRRLASNTAAVVCVDVDFAITLLKSDRLIYATYANQVCAGSRRRALPEYDRTRGAIECRLFGLGAPVVYAALAAPGQGLYSYGSLALRLKEVAIADRASLLEENSYSLVKTHRDQVPLGCRAAWEDRDSLMLVKLARVSDGDDEQHLRRRLLFCVGDRDSDSFIEVHIWGGFGIFSVESIEVLAPPCNEEESVLYRIAEANALRKGIDWNRV